MPTINLSKGPRDENDKRHGEWVSYYVNGGVFRRSNFVHGFEHGLCEAYFEDDVLFYRGYWNMDRKFGYWHYPKGSSKYHLCLV